MKPLLLLPCVLLVSGAWQPAAQAPPDTEIYLAPLSRESGAIKIGKPVNITNSPGYDNQPSFTPDGCALLFTSARGAAAADTDIYRYDMDTRQVARVTETAEREYSPTVMPDGKHISVVRVEADGTQRLWKFTLDGKQPTLVLGDVKPVGYHAWMDDASLALFVLGQPPTLQVGSTASGKAETIVTGIGRSVQRMPDGGISFVRREAAEGGKPAFTIMKLTRKSGGAFETSELVEPPSPGNDPDLAWTPDGTLLVASGGTLHAWRVGDSAWKPVADLRSLGLQGVSRLAVNPAGDRLALVAQQ
jgi:WD40 repeat protein